MCRSEPIRLRPYQLAAVKFLHTRRSAFICAPAGSGKTPIAAKAAADVAQPLDRVVWLANTREQCDQARKAIANTSWQPDVDITVKCVAGQPDVTDADILILDECHHLPAATWYATASKAGGIIWGFSATPWHSDEARNAVLRDFFGQENFFVVSREEVKAGGHLADGRVYFHDLDIPGEFDSEINRKTFAAVAVRSRRFGRIDKEELIRRAKWQFTSEAIRANPARNSAIRTLSYSASMAGSSVLVLVASIEHGEKLAACIAGAVMVHAKVGIKKRRQIIANFRNGNIPVLIATSLADEGLDVPIASVLILACGGRSAGKIEQRAGRVMRPHAGKQFGTVHDFCDRGSVMGAAQARSRERVYRSLGYLVMTVQKKEVAA